MDAPVVAPYTGAWIEIIAADISDEQKIVAPYTGAWIEITIPQQFAGVNAVLGGAARTNGGFAVRSASVLRHR